MLHFALKNMAIKKIQIILVTLSIVISAGIGVLAYNVSSQVDDGITENAGYYSMIVGPAGSKTQLAMNSMYFTEEPVGTLPYNVVSQLSRDSRVTSVIPYAMADNYNGSKVIGTETKFLINREVAEGKLFDDKGTMEVVVGSNVAKYNNLAVGDVIHTSHSTAGSDVHAEGLTVSGILKESNSSYDNAVFTQLETLWEVHEHGEANEAPGEEEHQHEAGMVCAVLINTQNPGYAVQMVNEYDGKIVEDSDGDKVTLQAIEPMEIVRDVLKDADNTKYIVFILCVIIMLMNIMMISIVTLLNTFHSAKEISLMRLIGVSMRKINLLYIIQNSIIGLFSTVLAFLISRGCLVLMNGYVSSMGIVLDTSKVYLPELLILLIIFVISVLPTVIWTFMMSKKDSISD